MPTKDAELANAILLGDSLATLANRHKTEHSWSLLSELKMKLDEAGFKQPELWVDYVLKRIVSVNQYREIQAKAF